jgi:magnesium-transporting ATPase (P-type)
MLGGVSAMFIMQTQAGADVAAARTAAVNTLVAFESVYLLACRYRRGTVLSLRGLTGNRPALIGIAGIIGLQALFTFAPPMQALFDTAPLAPAVWLHVLGFAAVLLLMVEAFKLGQRRLGNY